MADISQYLNEILNAVYGEEVRSSIYNAIDIINKVGEKNITLGTDVSSSSSPVTGYYSKSVYINTNTWDMWRCTGSAWEKVGNLLGSSIGSFKKTGTKTGTNGLVDIYHIYTDNDVDLGSFEVTNAVELTAAKGTNTTVIDILKTDGGSQSIYINDGAKISVGTEVTSTNSSVYHQYGKDLYINTDTWDLWQCTASTDSGYGNTWKLIGNIKGAQGIQGIQGIQGYSISEISKTSSSGVIDTYTVKNSNNEDIGTFDVTNGSSISTIEKTSSSGMIDTYTITLTDGNTTTFEVINGVVLRFYNGEINEHATAGKTTTCSLANIYPNDNVKVDDVVISQSALTSSVDYTEYSSFISYWTITEINGDTVTLVGLKEYGVKAGTKITLSKSNNVLSITSTDYSGTNTKTVFDGTKVGYGTDVSSTTDPITIGDVIYYKDDIYINKIANVIWKCTGTAWEYGSSIRGDDGGSIVLYSGSTELTTTPVNVSETDLTKGSGSIINQDIIISYRTVNDDSENSLRMDFWNITGTVYSTPKVYTLSLIGSHYIKRGLQGIQGIQGYSIKSVSELSKSGRVTTYRVLLDNDDSAGTFEVYDGETGPQGLSPVLTTSKTGTITTVTVVDGSGTHSFEIKDGDSGDGSGDMLKSVYDADDDGFIDMTALPLATDADIRTIISNR